MSDLDEDLSGSLIDFACRLADAAAGETLPRFRASGLSTDNKADGGAFDPVTEADKAAERAMRAIIERERPEDGILGEEEDARPSRSGITWVLDPIDGTRAYMSGLPTWGTLIAAEMERGPVLGLVDQPYIGERFIGGPGRSEVLRHGSVTALGTRDCGGLEQATLFTTFPEIGTDAERAAFGRVRDSVRLTRYGCDCYAYALLAAGQIDLVIEAGLYPYDIQGPMAVIAAAGGIVTNWDGGPAHRGGRVIAAGDARIHAAALELLAGGG